MKMINQISVSIKTKLYSSLEAAVSGYNNGIIGANREGTILWDAREILPGDSLGA